MSESAGFIDDLVAVHDVQTLDQRGQFIRVSLDGEESTWYCDLCGSLDVDVYEGVCYGCRAEEEEEDDDCEFI